jgi:superfamily I DNA and RNA helicase
VAGSGKTVILIARAKLLAEDLEKRILILCNNRLLAQHLAVALAGHRHVTATTFHRWAVRCGIDFREGEEDGAFGERLLARLRGDAGPRGGHDAVLIDEAQDRPCSWFQCARLARHECRHLEIGGRRQRVKPGDIAVLYPRCRPDAAVTALGDRLNGFTRAVLPAGDKPTGTLRDEAVKILPMHSARGLQFRIVLLLWTDLLPSPFKSREDGIDRGLLYVAMTRAEEMLVILHSGSSSYVEELYRTLGTVPP